MQEKSFLGHSVLGFHRVAYAEWGEAGANPPVICVHGLTRNGRDFDVLATAMQNERKLFCPDIVGRGRSDWLADPAFYNYGQYVVDMAELIAIAQAEGSPAIDWVGTSMGGLIGMLLAADANTPIRRLILNDVGPFIPLTSLQRIGAYVSDDPEFADLKALEAHLHTIYAPFGRLSDENWRHLAEHSYRVLPNGKFGLTHDPAIGKAFAEVKGDVDLWAVYDRIRCPVLLLHGTKSDVLTADVAQEMTQRGPRAKLIEFKDVGHAPALMDKVQIAAVKDFLAR